MCVANRLSAEAQARSLETPNVFVDAAAHLTNVKCLPFTAVTMQCTCVDAIALVLTPFHQAMHLCRQHLHITTLCQHLCVNCCCEHNHSQSVTTDPLHYLES
jgi:hypothetical protein